MSWRVGQAYDPYPSYRRGEYGYWGAPRPPYQGAPLGNDRPYVPEEPVAAWTSEVLSGIVSGVVVAILAPVVYRLLFGAPRK